MANDKQYRVTVGGESQIWDTEKYERNKDLLTSSYPDAKVEEVGYMSANEEQVIPGEKYRVTIGNEQQEWDSEKLNRNKGHLLQQYPDAKIERLGVIGSQSQQEQNDNVETNFFKGMHQTNKNIWQAGLWHSLSGEIANLFTGSSREEAAALNDIEYLESLGIDPKGYLEDIDFRQRYGMDRAQFETLSRKERRALERAVVEKELAYPISVQEQILQEREQRESVMKAYRDALAEAGGDLDKAKEILKTKAEDKTWGDKQLEKANAIVAENKELQGAAKWGGLAASAIPSAAALGLSFLTKGRSGKVSQWLNTAAKVTGNVGMAGMAGGTAGLSMIEARQHGATNWQVWTTGIADGLIEFITEKIPFDKLTKPVLTAAKTRTTKALMDAMRRVDSPGRKELEKLLTEANKKLGGKLLNGKNVADWLANAATEGVSEATAEALQTVTSMIYLNPEEYPTFAEVVNAAWEGAKGGMALGGVLGGTGKAVEHSLHKDRRKQQGFVNVALVEQDGKNPFVAELVDYDPETKTYKALQDGEIVDVEEDEIQYKHQYTYNEFESGRYRQLEDEAIADGTVSDAQVAVSADRLGNARQKLQQALTESGYTDEEKNQVYAALESGDIPDFHPQAKALWDAADEYTEALKRDKKIQSAKDVKAENERRSVLDVMTQMLGGEFWQKGSSTMQENGMEIIEPDTVEIGTMQDGKQVFILSTPNDSGEVAVITEDGKKMFIRHTDLQDGTTIMSLQEFLDARVTEQKRVAEQERMAEEAVPQLDAIRQKYQMGTQVNLGTEESPTLGQVIGIKPENDGVFIQTEAGIVPYTYEQLADIAGTPIRVMTDAQIAAAEAAEIEAAESARMSELAETPGQMTDAETVGDNAVQMENMATEMPLPLNSDGSVNQDALFKESPARWAEWNDERKQDGGASSAQYISGKLAKAQARLAELQAAYEVEDSLNKKELLEKSVIEQQGVVDDLAEVMQKYAPAETAPVQTESVQPVPAATQQERTTESVLASLNDGTLTDEEIRANIDANLAEAQKAYDKYAKKAPKMGTDKDAYLAEKQKYEQGLPALQQEIDFWNGVKQTYESAMQQETMPTEESFRPELAEEDMEPQSPQELAARELGLKEGGIKLLWDSVKAHTGFGNGERQKFFGIFRSKDMGGMAIEAAGERLMEIDREYDLGLLDQSDPMAGVNAILDVLGDVQTIGDLRNYIANNREAQVAREAAAAYSAMNAEFEVTHGMTMEEWAHANEVQKIEIMSKSALTEAEEYERNVKFAEEEYQYGTNEQSTGTEGVSGEENQEDAGNVEGAADSLYRQGDSILQEAQPDNTGGETVSAGQTEENVSESDNQDGDTSVHAGEQTAEVDDLPPAYRGVDRSQDDAEHLADPLAMTIETRLKLMAETREAIHERVNTWSNKLGIKINIIDNYRDVQNKDAKKNIADGNPTFGWFEQSTGEIFIYVPDYLNYRTETALKEVEKTILHEGIAHKGMREMLGEEKYGEFCDKVWNEVMTEKQRKEFIKYPGVYGNTRAAADEFIASVSENVKQDTVWDKIANFFKDILNSIGIEIKVADNDLEGLLKQSYRRYRKGEAKTNPSSNQQAEGNTSLRSARGSLVGMHNISEDKLRKVLKQGGLANPSTAVVNIAEYLLDGYGDISLIMPSSLVDASTGDNIGTYTGDAWTPTYPPISRKVDDNGWKVIKDLIRSVVSEDSPLYRDIINGLENYLEDNRGSKMEFVFLKEKGIEPEIAYKGADGFVGMRNLEAILGVQGLRDGLESYERYKNASPMAKRSFNMWLDAAGNKQAHRELIEQLKKEPKLAEVLKLNEDVSFAEFDSFTYDLFRKEQDAGMIDTYDTMGAAARYVDANNLRGEFEAWLESLMEQAGAKEVFFAGFTRDGDRIYKDNTLENVSRYMRLQGRTNAYDDHGLSATKSALLQRLTSLSQIRKNKARLQNESAYNKEYDALKDRLFSIISQLADMQEISSNRFMNVDYAESRLQEAITKRNPIAHLNKEHGYGIDPAGEFADELNSFIKDVQQMPAKYFETKFERPVYLNEFAAAVMPTTTSEDIKQAISEAGLPIFEYDSEVEGSRKEATLKATEGEGIRFRTARTEEEFNATQQEAVREKGIIVPGLWEVSFNVVNVPKHDFTGTGKTALRKAEDWALQNIAKEHIYHEGLDDEFRYLIDKDAIAKFLSQSSTKASDNLGVHLAALKMFPQIIDNSIDVEIHPDYRKVNGVRSAENGVKDEKLLVHRMYGAISIDGKVYRTKTTIHEFRDKTNEAYDYKITEIELVISGPASGNALKSPISVSAAKILKGVEKSYDKGVKVLDVDYFRAVEAGDMETAQRMVIEAAKLAMPNTAMIDRNDYPKIFYHNTDAEFTAFGAEYNGTATDAGWLGDGFYFYGDPTEGDLYGRNKMQVFLNIEEPYYATSEENKFLAEANSRKESIAFSERLKEEWYDGVYYNGDLRQEAVAFYPSQIKSADPVTYDDNGNVIPLSERFNEEKSDIRFRTTEIIPEVREEMAKIKESAERNGTYLKAPNGQPTNLTPEQWTMVRTEGFKYWFGDWEKDPENASKVVDENGEPMVVYHGTLAKNLTRFNKDLIGSRYSYDEKGFFFISRESIAKDYATPDFGTGSGTIIPAFINLENPLFVNQKWATKKGLGSRVFKDNDVIEFWDKYQTLMIEESENKDGVIISDGTDIMVVAFEPSQIKSATDNTGEFSESGDIRFRFIGEKGAANIDAATEDRWMAETLDRAKRMEGKFDAKTIKRATGWERGADKKWRYEEPDNIALKEDVIENIWENGDHGDNFLPDIIDAPELFRAYPELKNCRVRFYDITGAWGLSWGGTIDIHMGTLAPTTKQYGRKSLYGTLIHEIQHEIQRIEGFSVGEQHKSDAPDAYDMAAGEVEARNATYRRNMSYAERKYRLASETEDVPREDQITLFKTTGKPTEQVVKDGLVLSNEDFTNLAGNIFSAMPEDVRRKVVENAARDNYDLKTATLQMSASLAEKRDLTGEEIELAKMVAQKVEDAVLASGVEMTRPFTTNEALWVLYQSIYPTSEYDLIGNARKAVVADNLGFSKSQQAEQEKDADNIRFRSARGAAANSAAAMYNNEQRSAWGMLRETYQDMYRSVKSLMQSIEKTTGKVAQSWENILTSLNALSSKNLADKKKYLRDFLTPMWDSALAIRDKYHKSLEQIERHLMIKHGLERNKVLAARDARNFYREQADQEIAAIKTDKSLSKAEQKARIQRVEDTYDNHVSDIEAGIDAKFQEFRAKDYGGLTALFSDFADYGTREDYESEELYQEAALAARTPKYATLAETELAAQQEVDAFETEVDKALIDNLWKKINAATKETLRHQYANNLLTKEQYERVRDMFEFYVPLRGFVDTTAEDTYSYYVSGQQSKFANPLQGAKGRKTQAETPLGWIGSMAESAIQIDNKNTAKLALYYFAVNRPDNDILKITPTWYEWTGEVDADGKKIFEPAYPTFNGPQSGPAMQAQMDAFESMMEQQAQAGNAYKGKQRIDLKEAVIRAPKSAPEHVVTVKVAGEDYSIIINANPRAAQAINGMLNIDKGDNPLYRAARAILRFQASIKTSLAPLFWITNFMRDVSFAFINTSIRHDAGYTKEFAKNYPQAFRAFSYVHKNRKEALGDSKYEKYYTEFAENGGITGYTSLTNNTEYDQMMKTYANNARAGKFIKGIKGALEIYQDLGESFEQVSRFAAYITARESGKGISESIYEAKEVTINFNRKGSGKAITWEESGKMRRKSGKPLTDAERIFFVTIGGLSPVARSLFMFFNAGMQGVRMIAKLAHEHPGKSAAWAGIAFTMGLINAIMHAMMEDDDEYLDMPDYVRRTNILIGKNGTYFKWSLPHEIRPFYAMADIFVQHAMGRKPNENIVPELAETFGEWMPINPFKDGLNAFTPDIIRPFVEIKNNKDFTGSPIYREYKWLTEEQQKNMPAYEKGFDSTSKVLVDISKILNDVSGGDQTDAGFININPAVVEHLAQEYGGGPLKLAEQFFKTIGVMTGDQEFSVRNTPFLSTFMVADDDRYRNAHTTELFKYYKGMADDVKRRAGEYKAEKDKEGLDKLRASDDFQIFQIYRKYEKRDKFYNEQLKRAKSDSERKEIMSLQDAHRKRMIEEISKL